MLSVKSKLSVMFSVKSKSMLISSTKSKSSSISSMGGIGIGTPIALIGPAVNVAVAIPMSAASLVSKLDVPDVVETGVRDIELDVSSVVPTAVKVATVGERECSRVVMIAGTLITAVAVPTSCDSEEPKVDVPNVPCGGVIE